MVEKSNRIDVKLVLICVLFGAVCALAGWIFHEVGRPPAVIIPTAAAVSPSVSPVSSAVRDVAPTSTPQVVQVFISIDTVTSASGTPQPAPAQAQVVVGSSAGHDSATPATSRDANHRQSSTPGPQAHAAPAPTITSESIVNQLVSGTWIEVTATDGSIVLVGPGGHLVANTGDAQGGAVVALQTDELTVAGTPTPVRGPAGASTATTDVADPIAAVQTGQVQQSTLAAARRWANVSIDGLEDRSLHVVGDDQVITRDDSNVFINRNGPINANTGDTDSSGVIAVDVTDSTIRSGASKGIDDPAEPEEPEEPNVAVPASTTSDTASAGPTGEGGSLVIGGDGWDDLSVRTQGDRNVVTEDDSHVVLGGTGPVNAQVGDSDTAGVIVMGVHGSEVTSGCSASTCPAG